MGDDAGVCDLAGALCNLAVNDANKAAIASAGGIAPLIELVRGGTDGAKESAARALAELAREHADNCAAIALAGGIVPLVELVRSGTDGAKRKAARALQYLASDDAANRAAVVKAGGLPLLIELSRSVNHGATEADVHRWALRILGV